MHNAAANYQVPVGRRFVATNLIHYTTTNHIIALRDADTLDTADGTFVWGPIFVNGAAGVIYIPVGHIFAAGQFVNITQTNATSGGYIVVGYEEDI